MSETHLDGNAMGGALGEMFGVDITTAVGKCVHCGTTSTVAQARVYADAPGMVARCPACAEVLLRLARGPGRAWLDLRGVVFLEVAIPDS
jgi:Family of unknown function (DUF6510)